MNASTAPAPEVPRWRLRLRLLYRAYRYRWKNDPAEIAFVRAQVRPGAIAIDVGAHKGGYTYWLARGVGPTGRVYAFEPQPQLAHNLQRSFDPARVTVENAGVSDHEGAMQLHIPTDGRPSPGASLEATSTATATGHAIEVRVIALDRYLSDLPGRGQAVGFLKCDVEGHELHVFRGAEQMLRRATAPRRAAHHGGLRLSGKSRLHWTLFSRRTARPAGRVRCRQTSARGQATRILQ